LEQGDKKLELVIIAIAAEVVRLQIGSRNTHKLIMDGCNMKATSAITSRGTGMFRG